MAKAVVKPNKTISILNGLIETCRDGQQGFAEAAQHIRNPNWKAYCLEQSRSRAQFVGELQQEVQRLGGAPENLGTAAAALHRAWIDLKSALGGNDESIMAACETGEDSAIQEYQRALKEDLPENVWAIVMRQYQSVQSAHDQVKALRDSK
jgi:uncharacterized protein (TIGR02284 family)